MRTPTPILYKRGFTFVEILAALLFLAILIPAIVNALTISNRAAVISERSAVAVQLAENRLSQLIAMDDWQSGTGRGEFGDEWPGYRWEVTENQWAGGNMTELAVNVVYPVQGQERTVTLSTLVSATLGAGEEP